MGTERRKQILLGALLIALAVVVYRAIAMSPASPADAAPASTTANAASQRPSTGTAVAAAPDVHLESLKLERPKPRDNDRNLFRFKQKAPPPPPPTRATGPTITAPTAPMVPVVPSGPPPPPAITLKFIGVIEPGGGKPKIAILSDGQGPPMSGVEGGTVAGRYRIIRIGVESIEMSYLDGRGRQTIRLTGS
jgi:hypothetical protein